MAEMNIEKMAQNVAEKALDGFEYQGKTIREWMKIIAEQEPNRDIEEIAEIMKSDTDAETKCKMISNILTAKPHYFELSQEPKTGTGHWIKIVINGQHKIRCDKCDYIEPEYATHIRNFCPNCGERMVEPQENEEEAVK